MFRLLKTHQYSFISFYKIFYIFEKDNSLLINAKSFHAVLRNKIQGIVQIFNSIKFNYPLKGSGWRYLQHQAPTGARPQNRPSAASRANQEADPRAAAAADRRHEHPEPDSGRDQERPTGGFHHQQARNRESAGPGKRDAYCTDRGPAPRAG